MFINNIQLGMVVRSGDRFGVVTQIIPILNEEAEVSTFQAIFEVDFGGVPEYIQLHHIDSYIDQDGDEVPYWDEDDTDGVPLI